MNDVLMTGKIGRRGALWLLAGLWLALAAGCRERNSRAAATEETRMEVARKTWDFGEVAEGEEVCHTFRYRNTGEHGLLIKGADAGCTCTTVTYDRKPVAPGKEGKIEIVFNSRGRFGKQYKEITIFANVPEQKVTLSFTADVRN